MTAAYFHLSPSAIKEIVDRELGFKKISRRSIPHRLISAKKVVGSTELEIFSRFFGPANKTHVKESQQRMSHGFFRHTNLALYEESRSEIVPRRRQTVRAKTIMLPVFFSGEGLLALEAFPKGRKISQDCFL
jgi:hypothetical protein